VKRLGEQTALRIDEAQCGTDFNVGVLNGFEHGIDLSGKGANELGLVATAYVEPVVRLEPLADVPLFNLSFVALYIDDPDPGSDNDQVVDVRPTACPGTLRSWSMTARSPSVHKRWAASFRSPSDPLAHALVDCGSSKRNLTTLDRRPHFWSIRASLR